MFERTLTYTKAFVDCSGALTDTATTTDIVCTAAGVCDPYWHTIGAPFSTLFTHVPAKYTECPTFTCGLYDKPNSDSANAALDSSFPELVKDAGVKRELYLHDGATGAGTATKTAYAKCISG